MAAGGGGRTRECTRCERSRQRVVELEAEFQRLRTALINTEQAAAPVLDEQPARTGGYHESALREVEGGNSFASSQARGTVQREQHNENVMADDTPRDKINISCAKENAGTAESALAVHDNHRDVEKHNALDGSTKESDADEFLALVEEGNRLSITVDTIIRSQIFELKDLC